MEDKEIIKALTMLLLPLSGCKDFDVSPLARAGSNRRYFRLSSGSRSFVGTFVPDPAEGRCFVDLAEGLARAGADVPRVLAVSSDFRFYIQEDLGDVSLFSRLGSPDATSLVRETLSRLVRMQKAPEKLWKDACLSKPFCKRQVLWDLNYFKYEFLKPREVIFDEDRLEDEFDMLAGRLTDIPDEFMGFMMRDCQSRNVMITEGGPVFIDFQGGRRGPALYDAVSMLWQARAGFSPEFRSKMLDFYCGSFCRGDKSDMDRMLSVLDEMVLFRTLQVLGAYGFRGLVQRRAHFLVSIPGALANLQTLLDKGTLDAYPELRSCALALIEDFADGELQDDERLTVEVFSFSYKKGYPEDLSGNGGGFMFDCRALHNPGRYPEYRKLTGRDRPVIDFLEERGEVKTFLRSAWSLVDPAVERYLARGFSRLQVGFGCTGGQHRSVYSAERTAAHLRNLFPEVNVRVIHREHPE